VNGLRPLYAEVGAMKQTPQESFVSKVNDVLATPHHCGGRFDLGLLRLRDLRADADPVAGIRDRGLLLAEFPAADFPASDHRGHGHLESQFGEARGGGSPDHQEREFALL
jgi:hypothetical protein